MATAAAGNDGGGAGTRPGLVEAVAAALVVVLVAAMAVPQLHDEAAVNRGMEVRALAGSLRSAAWLGHVLAESRGAAGAIEAPGGTVVLVNGYPAAADILRLLEPAELGAFIQVGGEFRHRDAAGGHCGVSYAAPALAGAEPVVQVDIGGC